MLIVMFPQEIYFIKSCLEYEYKMERNMTILKSSNGIVLKKLNAPDGKSFCYVVGAKNLPIKEKVFNELEYEKALEYYEQALRRLFEISKRRPT